MGPPYIVSGAPQASLYSYPPSSEDSHYSKGGFTDSEAHLSREEINRTPSPTPSEMQELQRAGPFDWKRITNWRFWIRKEWFWYYVILVLLTTISVLVTLYHKQIVHWLTPAATWMHKLPFGWTIPIGVLFIISFPPLFGHEIVAILCGLVWGLWAGFGIVALGTFLGEVGNFYAFKYCCRARGEKLEKENLSYALLAKVVRDGGFKIALIARLSAIPGHFTTAVFSACGMGIIVFSIAAILSMPKQFITVYLGVILEQSDSGKKDPKTTLISNIALGVTLLITIVAMWYIYHAMGKAKPEVIYERRKARKGKASRGDLIVQVENWVDLHNGSEVDIPLRPAREKGVLALEETKLYAPQPKRQIPSMVGAYSNREANGEDHLSMGGPTKTGSQDGHDPFSSSDTVHQFDITSPPGLSLGSGNTSAPGRGDGYHALPPPTSYTPAQPPWHVPANSTDITDDRHSSLPYDSPPKTAPYPANLSNPFDAASHSQQAQPADTTSQTVISGHSNYGPTVTDPPTPF